ncbi:hypothetical protein, variant 2 [Exophiala mesophila]|nr:hypothetical protein, variant 1 [Exophiala mesophila]XP_016229257.1 hypothetical protein, variant 2 [Exophiala mesophila]KIV97682.1 hypothetical protein, variant 1 [Exophiala mesophila]KIV97683.1 hypothetical protein, variant 2 [Exophiala mesophila]
MRHTYQPTQHARDAMEAESSDSDVSLGGGDDRGLTAPLPLPPPPSKHALESSDGVQHRLDQLSKVEEMNIRKYDILKAKRKRKDERIRHKRDLQDRKWATITEARRRRDARIEARRKREDAAFTQFFEHDLEDEETNLRKRLKRLKRGLPPDESPQPSNSRIASASMSPPGSGLSTLPPPSKRHQAGPPGHLESSSGHSRLADPANLPPPHPIKTVVSNPPFSYYRSSESSSYSRPFHQSPAYSTPSSASPASATNGLNSTSQNPTDRSSLGQVSRSDSPHTNRATTTRSPATPIASSNTLARPASSSYDTRPPPTTGSSGFATVNTPTSSGYAAINPRGPVHPASSHVSPHMGATRDADSHQKTANQQGVAPSTEGSRFHPYSSATTGSPSTTVTATTTPTTTNKRTPSTTHPYQMSEAFANRHHHCERVDVLNRGIWTSYGVGGTQENPTGPPTEMYLRCNHDGCSRIDWRTVHGLQCHIVKNHEQPKGTIGSLDKALEKYGVPVKEVEKHESEHGSGSAGTVADPKNHKIKVKTKEQLNYAGKSTPTSQGVDLQARPAGWRPTPSPGGSPPVTEEIKRSPLPGFTNGFRKENLGATKDNQAKPVLPRVSASPSITTFSSITGTHVRSDYRSDWLGRVNPPTSHIEPEPKKLQGDIGSSDGSRLQTLPPISSSIIQAPRPVVANEARPLLSNAPSGPKPAEAPTEVSSNPRPAELQSSSTTVPATDPKGPVASVVEPKKEAGPSEVGVPRLAQEKVAERTTGDGDTVMTGTENSAPDRPDAQMPGGSAPESEQKPEEPTNGLKEVAEDQSETIVVDGDASKTAPSVESNYGRRGLVQSPTLSNKTLPAVTPGSTGRRLSRRSSTAARQSVEAGDLIEARASSTTRDDEKDEKYFKDDRDKSPPRRVLRRGRV